MKMIKKTLTAITTSALLITGCHASQPDLTVKASAANQAKYNKRPITNEVFYFVMPDRFHNGNKSNDQGDPKRPISYGGLDKTSKRAFHGGDITGLEKKLDYLQELGITAIWMTPVLRNKAVQKDGFAHHGYWVIDFTEIDPHFGSNEDLKNLIEKAHARNIKVFFDIITNHTADVIKYKECHNEQGKYLKNNQQGCDYISTEALASGQSYRPFVPKKERGAKVPQWLNDTQYYNNQGDTTWEGESAVKGDFAGLDDIDTSQPEVIKGLIEVFKDLVTNFKPDGFRIDTVKHVDIEFWQSFSPALIAHAQSIGIEQFFMFGEVYSGKGDPNELSRFTTAGKLPSVLDFGFAFNAQDVAFKQKGVSQLRELFANDDYYRDGDSNPNDLLTFLGNHDMGRAGYFIEKNNPHSTESDKLAMSKIAHALMYYSRGIPVVYYGDEQGFTGDGWDVDSREDMDPSLVEVYNDNNLIGSDSTTAKDNFNQQHPLYKTLSALSTTRLTHSSLYQGEHIHRLADNNQQLYAFSRVDYQPSSPNFMHDYLIVFNFSNQPRVTEIDAQGLTYTAIDGVTPIAKNETITFSLPPNSYSVTRSTKPLPASTLKSIKQGKSYTKDERLFVPFELEFERPERINLAKLEVYKHTSNQQKQRIAFDTTYPYRAIIPVASLEGAQRITITVTNLAGQKISKELTL
jgi:glycosidase